MSNSPPSPSPDVAVPTSHSSPEARSAYHHGQERPDGVCPNWFGEDGCLPSPRPLNGLPQRPTPTSPRCETASRAPDPWLYQNTVFHLISLTVAYISHFSLSLPPPPPPPHSTHTHSSREDTVVASSIPSPSFWPPPENWPLRFILRPASSRTALVCVPVWCTEERTSELSSGTWRRAVCCW